MKCSVVRTSFSSEVSASLGGRWAPLISSVSLLVAANLAAASDPVKIPSGAAAVVELEGKVEAQRAGATRWDPAYVKPQPQVLFPGDRIRTAERSRAVLRLSDHTVIRMGELGYLELPPDAKSGSAFRFLRGVFYFFHRDKPGDFPIQTPTVSAVVRGTEFAIQVDPVGTTTLNLIDGTMVLVGEWGQTTLNRMESAVVGAGLPPRTAALVDISNIVQWAIYYPGILHLDELPLTGVESAVLKDSLEAYRRGNLPRALGIYPETLSIPSAAVAVYRASLVLAAGQVAEAEALLRGAEQMAPADERITLLAAALRWLIAAVNFRPALQAGGTVPSGAGQLSTLWLADSYYKQSQSQLAGARESARRAVQHAPDFAFAQVRLAELEFSLGRRKTAVDLLERALDFGPENAQAFSLRGFVLAAENLRAESKAAFQRAIDLDGALSQGWFGRGLMRLHEGDVNGGVADLLTAVALEPQRAVFRSYLGKAFQLITDPEHASAEFRLAKALDPADPTAWLYSALFTEEFNRVNEAVRDLERSVELNDNRRLYRSEMLLDQDRGVRGANLARVYQRVGMAEVAGRAAVRAVQADYANHSAHRFLANSYNALRDPRQVSLRFETAWLSEHLLANLLAPAGAGSLSPYVSQYEYSRLFDQQKLGFVSHTEYQSRGDWVQQASQYGSLGNGSYSADLLYRSENGTRPNNDLELYSSSLQFKHDITPDDTLFLNAMYYHAEGGDLRQLYLPSESNPQLRFRETQDPVILAGYHHQWRPGTHTLVLVGRLADSLRVSNPEQSVLFRFWSQDGHPGIQTAALDQKYRSDLEIGSIEVQQISQAGDHSIIIGSRFQGGEFENRSLQRRPNLAGIHPIFRDVLSSQIDQLPVQEFSPEFERLTFYAYDHWEVASQIRLTAGVAYDHIAFPSNHRFAPLTGGHKSNEELSPKAGVAWTPRAGTTLRAAYSAAIAGASIDQSFQLEPTQIAGLVQSYRSLIPESVAASSAGARFDGSAIALEQKLGSGTYLGLAVEQLNSSVDRDIGVFDVRTFQVAPAQTRQNLDFQETSASFTANQLVGTEWFLAASYRYSQARLDDSFPQFRSAPENASFDRTLESVLHRFNGVVGYQHASGWFGRAEALALAQSNSGYDPDRPGDRFWQGNLFGGFRFSRRRAEVEMGVLNIFGRDYRLNPLNLVPELPRERTWVARVSLAF